jgi:Ser/Thr protein kinase RdoA (MazF antagonist)
MISAERVRALVSARWHRRVAECTAIAGGMNSSAWLVVTADERYAAKVVPAAQRAQFHAGLLVAARLENADIRAGAPVRAADGALTVPLGDGVLALLRNVPGEALDRRERGHLRRWGETLGVVHRTLTGYSDPALTPFHWVRPRAAHLSVEPWVRPAVASAVAAVDELCAAGTLSHGVLHGDPAPDAFLLDPSTGRTGLIDWGAAVSGPLVYDVASAVMYAGGRRLAGDLLDGYLATGPLRAAEVDGALPTMLRFRFAVQADYFAHRLAVDDRTGISGAEENWAGLHDARDMLADSVAGSGRWGRAARLPGGG